MLILRYRRCPGRGPPDRTAAAEYAMVMRDSAQRRGARHSAIAPARLHNDSASTALRRSSRIYGTPQSDMQTQCAQLGVSTLLRHASGNRGRHRHVSIHVASREVAAETRDGGSIRRYAPAFTRGHLHASRDMPRAARCRYVPTVIGVSTTRLR